MLNTVEVRTPQGTLLTLPLTNKSSGLIVSNVAGLDPVKATIVTSSFARMDGTRHHSSRRESRNIVFTIEFKPSQGFTESSVEEARERLSRFFMPKRPVDLTFVRHDGARFDISGRVESFEAPLFEKEPKATISVICFNPDFVVPTQVLVNGESNSINSNTVIDYQGTIESGFVLSLYPADSYSEFEVHMSSAGYENQIMEFALDLAPGDVLQISTIPGNKYVTLEHNSVHSSALYALSPYSPWMELNPDDNEFRVHAEGVAIPWYLVYTNKYGSL